jgi:hypothetical protein
MVTTISRKRYRPIGFGLTMAARNLEAKERSPVAGEPFPLVSSTVMGEPVYAIAGALATTWSL